MARFHQRYIEGAQPNWCARVGDHQAFCGKSMAAADIGRGLAADQLRPGAVGDQRGIQRVVEMRVHRDDSRQPRDADACQASVDPGRRRRDLAQRRLGARPGREKKPSVITAEDPSSISSVETPSHVTVSGASGSATGTLKRCECRARSGRPGRSRISRTPLSRCRRPSAGPRRPMRSAPRRANHRVRKPIPRAPRLSIRRPRSRFRRHHGPSTRSAIAAGSCSTAPVSRRDTSWPFGR